MRASVWRCRSRSRAPDAMTWSRLTEAPLKPALGRPTPRPRAGPGRCSRRAAPGGRCSSGRVRRPAPPGDDEACCRSTGSSPTASQPSAIRPTRRNAASILRPARPVDRRAGPAGGPPPWPRRGRSGRGTSPRAASSTSAAARSLRPSAVLARRRGRRATRTRRLPAHAHRQPDAPVREPVQRRHLLRHEGGLPLGRIRTPVPSRMRRVTAAIAPSATSGSSSAAAGGSGMRRPGAGRPIVTWSPGRARQSPPPRRRGRGRAGRSQRPD